MKSEFSRIYNETYRHKVLVGITLSIRIVFICGRRLKEIALGCRMEWEDYSFISIFDVVCCASSDDYSLTNILGWAIIKKAMA